MPVVSAIITTFNRRKYLTLAIQSVLSQTFADFELLILDNSSTDGTDHVVKETSDSRIRYIKHPAMGISPQRNLGLAEARGEFVAFLDDDDEWLPRKLELELDLFRKGSSSLALTYGGLKWIDTDGKVLNRYTPKCRGRVLQNLLSVQDPFTGSASNPMIRIAHAKAVSGYDETVTTGEDWEFYLRLSERFDVDFTPEPVVLIRQHSGPRLVDRVDGKIETEKLVLDRYGPVMSRTTRSFYQQIIGGKWCRVGELSRGRTAIIQAIRTNPLNYKAFLQLILSLGGARFYNRMHRVYRKRTSYTGRA